MSWTAVSPGTHINRITAHVEGPLCWAPGPGGLSWLKSPQQQPGETGEKFTNAITSLFPLCLFVKLLKQQIQNLGHVCLSGGKRKRMEFERMKLLIKKIMFILMSKQSYTLIDKTCTDWHCGLCWQQESLHFFPVVFWSLKGCMLARLLILNWPQASVFTAVCLVS